MSAAGAAGAAGATGGTRASGSTATADDAVGTHCCYILSILLWHHL